MSIKPKLKLTIEVDKKKITYKGVSKVGEDIQKYEGTITDAEKDSLSILGKVFEGWVKHLEKYENQFGY